MNHGVQWDRSLPTTTEYMKYLKFQIENLDVDLVAEEFSEESLKLNGVEYTTSDQVSKKQLNKKSVLCDPDEKTREKIG